MDEEIRRKLEAILFSVGRKVSTSELSKMTKIKDKGILVASLIELKKKYSNDSENSLMILQDGDDWKLTIKDQYIEVAKEVGIETELTKSVMETLAVIAYKNPILQSEVIKVRTNKAYDHLKELEQMGYIQREMWGRTKKIKLTSKFFDYFDLPPGALKDTFASVEELEKKVEEKEQQLHDAKIKHQENIDENKRKEIEMESKNIYMEIKVPNDFNPKRDLDDEVDYEKLADKLEEHEEIHHDKNGLDIIDSSKMGILEVVDEEPTKEELEKTKPQIEKKDPEKLGEMEIFNEENSNYISSNLEEESDEDQEDEEYEESILEDENFESENADIESDKEEAEDQENNIEDIQEAKDSLNQNSLDDDEIQDNNDSLEDSDIKSQEESSNKAEDQEEDKVEIDEDSNKNSNSKSISPEDLAKAVEEELKKQQDNDDIDTESDDDIQDDDETTEENQSLEEIEEEANIDNHLEPLKEEELFEMEGIPKKIMEKIEEKAEEIIGEKQDKKQDDILEL